MCERHGLNQAFGNFFTHARTREPCPCFEIPIQSRYSPSVKAGMDDFLRNGKKRRPANNDGQNKTI